MCGTVEKWDYLWATGFTGLDCVIPKTAQVRQGKWGSGAQMANLESLHPFGCVHTCVHMHASWVGVRGQMNFGPHFLPYLRPSLFSHGPSGVSWHTSFSWLILLVTSFLLGGHAGVMGINLTVSVFHVGSGDPSSWRHHGAARSLPTEPFPQRWLVFLEVSLLVK